MKPSRNLGETRSKPVAANKNWPTKAADIKDGRGPRTTRSTEKEKKTEGHDRLGYFFLFLFLFVIRCTDFGRISSRSNTATRPLLTVGLGLAPPTWPRPLTPPPGPTESLIVFHYAPILLMRTIAGRNPLKAAERTGQQPESNQKRFVTVLDRDRNEHTPNTHSHSTHTLNTHT